MGTHGFQKGFGIGVMMVVTVTLSNPLLDSMLLLRWGKQ
jgi:hypothetical protein